MANPLDRPPADLASQLSYRLHLLHKLTDLESQRRYPLETGLSLSDGRSLSVFGDTQTLTVTTLARLAHLNKAQASRAAQSLVDQGLLSKADSDSDGRSVQLKLTPPGRLARARTMALIEQRNAEMFGGLSEPEQRLLGQLLDRLIAQARATPV
jgi:DNA-binding MarR family transcriptional regulator